MRVITQLIQHFWQRRDLSTEQAAYLVDQGFVRAGELEGFEMPPEIVIPIVTRPTISPPDALESLESELVAQAIAPKRGSGKAKGAVLTQKQLVAAVEDVLAERCTELEALRTWASRFGASRDWADAVAKARKASVADFDSGLADGLRRNAITLQSLWSAVDVETLHAVIDNPNLRGPLIRAFRLLLNTDQRLHGKHALLLKNPTLKATRGLAELHRRLLAALVGLYEHQPRLLSAALGNGHPVAHWSLTLVYNARRKPLDGPMRPAREYGPLPLPEKQVWRPAWSAALRMDPAAVTKLIVACYADAESRKGRDPIRCAFPFHSPRTWKQPFTA